MIQRLTYFEYAGRQINRHRRTSLLSQVLQSRKTWTVIVGIICFILGLLVQMLTTDSSHIKKKIRML